MRSTPQSAAPGGPRTYIGLWLRAGWRGDNEEHKRLLKHLNRGEKGWNEDEPAVIEAACQLAVRRLFAEYPHVSIEEFVRDMRERNHKQKTAHGREDMEAVVRAALDDSVSVPPHIRRGELLEIQGAVAFNIISILKFDDQALEHFIVEAEALAMERGYQPPLATEW
jgi:hypothetical protein